MKECYNSSKNGINSYYIINPGVVFREEEGGGILFNPDTGEVKLLNETGALIFKLCDGRHKEEDIVKKVLEVFNCSSREKVERDVKDFIREMLERKLVGILVSKTE